MRNFARFSLAMALAVPDLDWLAAMTWNGWQQSSISISVTGKNEAAGAAYGRLPGMGTPTGIGLSHP